jgi:DNA mismatch repair protein MutS
MSLTPMMRQYKDIKEKHKDCILMFRLGDFYEMFFEDAEIASRELEITLTGRDCGLGERAPMCGVPYHSVDTYISRLIKRGYKVAICEQTEDPATAKGLVRRDVVRVITPGTVTDPLMLEEKSNNYIMAVYKRGYCFGLCAADISTGELRAAQVNWGNTHDKLVDEIARYSPSEMIVNSEFANDSSLFNRVSKTFETYISRLDDTYFDTEESVRIISDMFRGCELLKFEHHPGVNASGALLRYIIDTQKADLIHIKKLESYNIEEYMILDAFTRRNLEITETMRQNRKKGSLLWVLDRTVTAMGGRTLKRWIEQPLLNTGDIINRLDAVEELKDKFMVRMELMELLKGVYDIERLLGKVVMGSANCRDLTAMKKSFGRIPSIKEILRECTAGLNRAIFDSMDDLADIYDLIDRAIVDDPPITVKEGGIIKDGYNEDVDMLRKATTQGKEWIAALENEERQRTGIKNLRVGYNKVFGYYIEVTKSHYSLVPDDYIRKQTLVNCERYITPELKEMENKILGAEEKIVNLEYELFVEVRERIMSVSDRIKSTAASIAMLDALCSLAEVADRENYCRPLVDDGEIIRIKDGRHPVVEKMIENESFVPNDTFMDMHENRLLIITGPNMAGKSTYLRQTAIIVLMAQAGSFVPASSAQIGLVDRIFTRVGASDDLASGRSTFMVEMSEVAHILENATPRSLLILDEIGRGTSTYDGLSIAWSVIEYINDRNKLGSRTLFATHYHELTDLEGMLDGVKNYCIKAEEKGEDVVFLRKIVRGGADDSYGIHVAKLAGIPETVIARANEILKELEDADISKKARHRARGKAPLEGQIDLFSLANRSLDSEYSEIIREIKDIGISTITPVEALNRLYSLQEKIRKIQTMRNG